MSDITISFPPAFTAWVRLGEATPVISVALAGLLVAYFLGRRSAHAIWRRGVNFALAIVGGAWLGGISFWTAGLLDQITTAIYEAQHHYRLDKRTVMAGIEIPAGSWVWVDEQGVLYEIQTAPDAAVAIDGARWRGDIRLAGLGTRAIADRARVIAGVLAEDTAIQGVSCRAGQPAEFSEPGDELLGCTLARRAVVTAETRDAAGDRKTADVACAADREIVFRAYGDRLLERCVLAEVATLGPVSCAAGAEIVLSGDGLGACMLASEQLIGPFALAAGTPVGFMRGRLDRFEIPRSAAPIAISSLDLPPGSSVHLCERAWDLDWVSVPENSYVTVAGVKLTGGMNFDCGRFQFGALFEDTVLRGRMRPRGSTVLQGDLATAAPR